MQASQSLDRTPLVVAPYPVAERAQPPHQTGRRRLAAIRQWTGGFGEVLLVGVALPAGVLLVGLPVAFLIALLIELVSWL